MVSRIAITNLRRFGPSLLSGVMNEGHLALSTNADRSRLDQSSHRSRSAADQVTYASLRLLTLRLLDLDVRHPAMTLCPA